MILPPKGLPVARVQLVPILEVSNFWALGDLLGRGGVRFSLTGRANFDSFKIQMESKEKAGCQGWRGGRVCARNFG